MRSMEGRRSTPTTGRFRRLLKRPIIPKAATALKAGKLPGWPLARHPPIPTTSQSGKVVMPAMIFSRKCWGVVPIDIAIIDNDRCRPSVRGNAGTTVPAEVACAVSNRSRWQCGRNGRRATKALGKFADVSVSLDRVSGHFKHFMELMQNLR